MAIAFPESNSVMITAPAVILDACEQVIREVDVEPKQVYIEARFVELSNDVFHDIGIDWSMLDGMKGAVSLAGGIQKNRLGKGVQDYSRKMPDGTSYSLSGSSLVGGADGDIAYFNGTLDFSQMYIVLSALEGSEDARIFSNPKIIVSSGKKATVDMTTKYPNVKIAAKRTTNSGGDSLDLDMQMAAIPGEDKMMFANEAFFSWGISLDVTPRIGTNGLISVSIVPTISSQNGWVESGTESADSDSGTISARYPVIEVQRLVTEFAMASGTTAVIGGLSRTVEEQVDTGIPLLRDIPWIGPRIFGSRTRKKQQKEIIVFVTVGLVDPGNMQKDSGLPKNAVLGRQYTKGQKLEPGDRPEKNLEGISSLDLRSLEEQAEDPLPPPRSETSSWIPFVKDPNYKKEK
jgi:type II secretory pathway component GspD/PulD (secretin)